MAIENKEQMIAALERIGGSGYGSIKAAAAALNYSEKAVSNGLRGDYSAKFARAVEAVVAKMEEANIREIVSDSRCWSVGVPFERSRDGRVNQEVTVTRTKRPALTLTLTRKEVRPEYEGNDIGTTFPIRHEESVTSLVWLSNAQSDFVRIKLEAAAMTLAKAEMERLVRLTPEKKCVNTRFEQAKRNGGLSHEEIAMLTREGIIAEAYKDAKFDENLDRYIEEINKKIGELFKSRMSLSASERDAFDAGLETGKLKAGYVLALREKNFSGDVSDIATLNVVKTVSERPMMR